MASRRTTEVELVKRIRKKVSGGSRGGMVVGIGDDCAVFRAQGREDLLYTTDLLIEDVHFLRKSLPAAWVGRRALVRGLSDIAAMGGTPRFCLVSLALPEWADARWVDGFYRGLTALAQETGTAVAGGDLSRASQLVCDIVVCGSVARGGAMRRDGASPGDGIYVSGSLGGASLGLRTRKGAAWRRHARPDARLELGRYLRNLNSVTAAMDLSDGLLLDLFRMCEESGVSATIDRPLPVFHGVTIEDALQGGEDYELLFTAKQGTRVRHSFQGIPLTRIGTILESDSPSVDFFGKPMGPEGWDHFRGRSPSRSRQQAYG